MRYLALALALVGNNAQADTLCEAALRFEADTAPRLPQMVDEVTELFQVSVNCETETITYKRRVLVDPDGLANGWHDRKQRQHTQLHCNRTGLASVSGWRAMDIIYGPSHEYLVTLVTTPAECLASSSD